MSSESFENLKNARTVPEILECLDKIETSGLPAIKIGISSNVTVSQSANYFRKNALLSRFSCEISVGDYRNHIGNSEVFVKDSVDCVLLHNVFDNLTSLLETSVSLADEGGIEEILNDFLQQIRICLDMLIGIRFVFVEKLHSIISISDVDLSVEVNAVIEKFNQEQQLLISNYSNVQELDPSTIFSKLGLVQSIDYRYYYRFKAPFTPEYWDEYAQLLFSKTNHFESYFYKVLILDCDNTLWSGIIGEDLIDGISLSPHDFPGNIFYRVQSIILSLQKSGVLICLCSKNNPQDVDEVLESHQFQLIRNEHIILKKVNWETKVKNIHDIASELNLGLDSFVFIDDSEFEIESVNKQLPQVKTFLVPKSLNEYPEALDKVTRLFMGGGRSRDEIDKTKQYKQLLKTSEAAKTASSFGDYILGLKIQVELKKNLLEKVNRIAELTQKSNQFNLTTKRYTVQHMLAFMNSETTDVFSLNVSDKFGDSGLTGIVIVSKDESKSQIEIDSFLMSCRVLGRGIEYALWSPVLEHYISLGFSTMIAKFERSAKNQQVADFFETLGLDLVSSSEDGSMKEYSAEMNRVLAKKQKNVIEVVFDGNRFTD